MVRYSFSALVDCICAEIRRVADQNRHGNFRRERRARELGANPVRCDLNDHVPSGVVGEQSRRMRASARISFGGVTFNRYKPPRSNESLHRFTLTGRLPDNIYRPYPHN